MPDAKPARRGLQIVDPVAEPVEPVEAPSRPKSGRQGRKFSSGIDFIKYAVSLEQEREVYRHIAEYLDAYIDPDIGEPKIMRCDKSAFTSQVDQDVILKVYAEVTARSKQIDKELKSLTSPL